MSRLSTTPASETPRRRTGFRWSTALAAVAIIAVGLLVSTWLDSWAYRTGLAASEGIDWELPYLFRLFGYLPTWLVIGFALVLIDRRIHRERNGWTHLFRGIPLVAAAGLAGIGAELLKLIVRRQRPEYHDGAYVFRSWADRTFETGGLGMPSSHTAVAFGAAFVLTRMHPAAWPVWLLLGTGCAVARVMPGAHFLSDVFVGAVIGVASGATVWRWHLALNRHHLVEMGVLSAREGSTNGQVSPATRATTATPPPSRVSRPTSPGGAMSVAMMRHVDFWLGVPACMVLTVVRKIMDLSRSPARERPRRIVFIKLAEQGSTVLAAPAFRRAAEMVGRENVFFLVFEENRFIVDLMELIPPENVIAIRTKGLAGVVTAALGALRRLRQLDIDTAIDLEFFARSSACMALLSGAGRRVGFHAFGGEGPWRGDLMTHRLRFNPHLHTAQTFRLMVDSLEEDPAALPTFGRVPPVDDEPPPPFTPSPEEVDEVRDLLAESAGGTTPQRLVLLNANCSDLLPLRAWSTDRYVELARRLLDADPGLHVAMTGGPAEAEPVIELVKAVDADRCFNLAGRTTLRQLLVVYTLADVLVTNDSGPAHFATLTPIDVVTIFGPETPRLFAARSPRNHVLWAGLACSPCVSAFNNRVSPCRDNKCMQAIGVEEVESTVKRVLAARSDGGTVEVRRSLHVRG